MSDSRGFVKQQSRTSARDDSGFSAMHVNRDGLLEVNTIQGLYDYALRAGRVFAAGPDAIGALSTLEANATYDLTEPFFRATVPAGTVMIPISVRVVYDTAPAALDGIKIGFSDTDTYNAGGDVCRVRSLFVTNQGLQNPYTSTLSNVRDGDAVLTENALTNPQILKDITVVAAGSEAGVHLEYNALKGDPYAMIHGPASFLVWGKAAGAEEVYYTVTWIELDKNSLVNA